MKKDYYNALYWEAFHGLTDRERRLCSALEWVLTHFTGKGFDEESNAALEHALGVLITISYDKSLTREEVPGLKTFAWLGKLLGDGEKRGG